MESIKRVTPDITGIENVGYNKGLETEWIVFRQSGQSTKKAS